jgi:adenosylcobinamide-GDP ribazoletransferase
MTVEAVRDAVGLLTRLPLAVVGDRPGAPAFGSVGAAVGAAGAVPLLLLAGAAGEPWLGAVAAIATTTLLTGAIHLDGLADTADALLARDPVAAERARKDPALGSGGVTALVLAIGAEVVALTSLTGSAGAVAAATTFVAVSTVARVVPVVAARWLAARGVAGTSGVSGQGSWFTAHIRTGDAALAVGSAAFVVAGLGLLVATATAPIAVGSLVGAVLGLLTALWLIRSRGGLDGDGMGATIEASLIAGLVAAAVVA